MRARLNWRPCCRCESAVSALPARVRGGQELARKLLPEKLQIDEIWVDRKYKVIHFKKVACNDARVDVPYSLRPSATALESTFYLLLKQMVPYFNADYGVDPDDLIANWAGGVRPSTVAG